jgi:hypothetical protein
MSYGDPEITWKDPCPACGCRDTFTGIAPPGEREQPLFWRCCECGRERDDLDDFYNWPRGTGRLSGARR